MRASSSLDVITATLRRLDRHQHPSPTRLELSFTEGRWVAQIITDSGFRPLVGAGTTYALALTELARECSTALARWP